MEPYTLSTRLVLLLGISILIGYSEAGTPSISRCPSTIFRRVSSSEATISVTWDDPDCGTDATSTHRKGDEFGPGVHNVIYFFNDGSPDRLNQRCCSFDIFVAGPDFDLCSQNNCYFEEICEAGVDRYYCYPDDIVIRNCSSLITIRQFASEEITANWVEPTAYDYLGRVIQPSEYPAIVPGDTIPLGDHEDFSYGYRYQGPSGLVTERCHIRVIVGRAIGPGILSCPDDIEIVSSESMVKVDWLEPQIQPNEDENDVIIEQSHSSGQMFPVPFVGTVSYTFRNRNDRTETTDCSFTVETIAEVASPKVYQPVPLHLNEFFVITTSNQNDVAWPRPSLNVERSTYSGPVVIFPSRVQPEIGTISAYSSGFYPVTYSFRDTKGKVLQTYEFVVVYPSATEDDIAITCGKQFESIDSEVPVPIASWPTPVNIEGDEKDLAWTAEPVEPAYLLPGFIGSFSYLVYKLFDFPNRVTTCSITILVQDRVKPTVSGCPADITQTAIARSPPVSINFIEPTATDGCGNVTVERSPAAGPPITVEVGESTPVHYTFTDCYGMQESCEFVVTINSQAIPVAVIDNCVDLVLISDQSFAVLPPSRQPIARYDDEREEPLLIPPSYNVNTETMVTAFFASLGTNPCTFKVTVLDTIAPLVEDCDQMITTQSEEMGFNYMPVNWTEPRSVNNISGGELVYQSHFPMHPLPVGETTVVEYIFKDEANLTTICSINITVEEFPTTTCTGECQSSNENAQSTFFTSDVIIAIIVTGLTTFIVCTVVFMLSLCCCTCCCAVEQKHISPPPGRTQRTESGQDLGNQDARSSTDQSQMRFVIKLPGIGKVPIYGPVGPLRTGGAGTSRPANDGYEFDDGNQNGRSTAGYVNESFPTSSRGPRRDTADPFEDGPSRVVDNNDGQSYGGYDPSPQSVARPAPNPPLPPKPKTTSTIPKLSRSEFLEMQVEMNKIKVQYNQNERYIDDSEVYGFDSPPV